MDNNTAAVPRFECKIQNVPKIFVTLAIKITNAINNLNLKQNYGCSKYKNV